MKQRARVILGGFLVVVTAALGSTSRADDDKGLVIEKGPPKPEVLAAERKADAGDIQGALDSLLSVEPRISNANAGLGPPKDYALRVAAKIIARSDKPPLVGFPNDDEQRKWAFLQVRKISTDTNDPAVFTDLGEIASTIPDARLEAMKTLEYLETQNTMASSFGYAALARLRDDAGKDSGSVAGAPLRALSAGKRQIALVRCRKMAKVAATCERGWHAPALAKP